MKISIRNLLVFLIISIMSLIITACSDTENNYDNSEYMHMHSLETWYKDADGDGFSDETYQQSGTRPKDYFLESELTDIFGDCNDGDHKIHPNATEIPDDNIDQNCTGFDLRTWYRDSDGDGYSGIETQLSEDRPSGYFLSLELVGILVDPNDNDNTINPGATEIPDDDIDQNCNGMDLRTWYKDFDNDKFTDKTSTQAEERPIDYLLVNELIAFSTDCDDNDEQVYPGANEIPDNDIDEDCTGYDLKTWYQDADSDGYACTNYYQSEQQPNDSYYPASELIDILVDCDDNNSNIHPEAFDIPEDGIDQDCNDGDYTCPYEELVYYGNYEIQDLNDIQMLIGYTKIKGSLTIKSTELENLNSLRCLTEVTLDLVIDDNQNIENLQGLNKLSKVGTNWMGSGKFIIRNNHSLKNLQGLSQLINADAGFSICNNDSLTNLQGLDSLISVGQFFYHGFEISENDALINLHGLNSLTTVLGDLTISDNESISTLIGLTNLELIRKNLLITNNPSLEDLKGLNNLTATLNIGILNNDSLISVEDLSSLCSVYNFDITNNINLCTSDAESLQDQIEACDGGGINGNVTISDNKACDIFIE